MNSGIYIVANDKVIDNAIALLNSIRLYDPEVLVYLVPFDECHQEVARFLQAKHNVQLFPNLEFVAEFTRQVGEIFDRDFLVLPNKMRKFVLWFGPLEKFLYIDTDILVFEKIASVLEYLEEYEFVNCDYHYRSRQLQDVFSPVVRELGLFGDEQLEDVFNSGFWASRRGIFSEAELYELLRHCAAHREYFDFTYKTTDQPILNYIILKTTQKRLNLVKIIDKEPGSWAGSSHFQAHDNLLFDGDRRLRYLHWAGMPMGPGGPYREIWEHYRYLGEVKPSQVSKPAPIDPKWRKVLRNLKNQLTKK
ncbi:MAG: methionine synthase [Chloroflexaceae bacterium]|nr:methionine synthase [Chloroflexaceae bacterium]